MRKLLIIFFSVLSFISNGQWVLDSPFVYERAYINTRGDFYHYFEIMDEIYMMENSEHLDCYLFHEPYQLVIRKYHNIEFSKNPEFDPNQSFNIIINDAIKSDSLFVFKDKNFIDVFDTTFNVEFNSIVIKTDFFYNYQKNVIDYKIMGVMGFLSDSSMVWFYYPQLKSILKNHYLVKGSSKLSYSDYLNSWLFNCSATNIDFGPPAESCSNCIAFLEHQSEFDGLVNLFLVQKEIENKVKNRFGNVMLDIESLNVVNPIAEINFNDKQEIQEIEVKSKEVQVLNASFKEGKLSGKYIEHYTNGKIKEDGYFENGLRNATWTSYFDNGVTKAIKNYKNGLLDGPQKVYYRNKKLYLDYNMSVGECNGEIKKYYEDGKLKFSGNMEDGFVIGRWDYSIRINDKLKTSILKHPDLYIIPEGSLDDNCISYSVTYSYEEDVDNSCILGKCQNRIWSDNIE